MKACPFCSSSASPTLMQHARRIWTVMCQACEAEGPPKPSEAEAIEAWGKRAAPIIALPFTPYWDADLQYRRGQPGWPMRWRVRQITNKNERAGFRREGFAGSLGEALAMLDREGR